MRALVTPSGACIIDTPGLRNLRLDSDASAVATTFDDITHMALQCRFRDCKHNNEPGCAVQGAIPSERLRSFHKLLREAERDTLSAVQRKEMVQSWKARSRATRARMQNKRGEEKGHS